MKPRVVLLEDDASIRRFVVMALEELPIELIECDTVAQALAALRQAPPKLVITDLMLRNESGFDLMRAIEQEPALIGDGLVAVFSAGIGTSVLKQLAGHRVWRLLSKPTTVAALEACVRDAISTGEAGRVDQEAAPLKLGSDEDQAVRLHFGGSAALFTTYRASCLVQFAHDLASADSAVVQRDAAGLRRIGHNLKTVLKMIGQPELSAQAKALDEAAAGTDWSAAQRAWQGLRSSLSALLARG